MIGRLLKLFKRNNKVTQTIPALPSQPELKFLARIKEGTSLTDVELGGLNIIGRNVHFSNGVHLGYATTLGDECWVRGPVTFGNYCQMGPRVCFHATDHVHEYLTPYNNTNLFNGDLKQYIKEEKIVVGHGVWCGYGAIILKGVKISNGAVVGAGAVVTHNVPAYHIVGGNPAKVIRPRFDENICNLLEQTEWWKLDVTELEAHREAFHTDFTKNRELAIKLLREFIESKPNQ